MSKALEDDQMALMPRLRFPEFQGCSDWNRKPLGELLSVGNGKDYKHLKPGDIPVYGTGGYMLSVNDYLYDGESVCIGRKGTIDKPMFLAGKFWTVDTLFYTHSFRNCSPHFAYLIFQQINWLEHNEGGGRPSLSKRNVEAIVVATPKPEEQRKIADCLTAIDERLKATDARIDALKSHKKGLMQQLFPREGDTTPRLRFPEFRGAGGWKEKTLGEISSVVASGDLDKEYFSLVRTDTHTYPVYSNAVKERGLYGYYSKPKYPAGTITITARGTLGVAFNRDSEYMGIGRLLVVSDLSGVEPYFLGECWNYFGKVPSEVTSIPQFTAVAARSTSLIIPSIVEQQKIANCLSSLDELIAATTVQRDALREHKKGMMQQLFPSLDETSG